MIVFITSDGTVQSILPSPVYQGQGITGSLYLVAPFPNNNGVDVAFNLANGDDTQAYALTSSTVALPEVFNKNGENYSVWEWTTNNAFITAYAGEVLAQFRVYAFNAAGGQETIATAAVKFTVQKGVIPLNTSTPTPSQWANLVTLYTQVKNAQDNITDELNNKLDKVTTTTTKAIKRAYTIEKNGSQSVTPVSRDVAETIPIYSAHSTLQGSNAIVDNDYVPLNQVKGFLNEKLDKVISGNQKRVYGVNSDNTQTMYGISAAAAAADTLAARTGTGAITVANGLNPNEAVNVAQLEAQYNKITGEVGEQLEEAKTLAQQATDAAQDALEASERIENTEYKLNNLTAILNENIVKDPFKTYIYMGGKRFPSSAAGNVFYANNDCIINWGDGTINTYPKGTNNISHIYTDDIDYHIISIDGLISFKNCVFENSDIIKIYFSNNISGDFAEQNLLFNNHNLIEIKLPNEAVVISNGFAKGLNTYTDDYLKIDLPNNIQTIEPYAFQNKQIKKIIIPKSIIIIGTSALTGCEIVEFKRTTPITYNNFLNSSRIQKIIVPKSAINAYKTAAGWSTFADKIVYEVDSDDLPSLANVAKTNTQNTFTYPQRILSSQITDSHTVTTFDLLSGALNLSYGDLVVTYDIQNGITVNADTRFSSVNDSNNVATVQGTSEYEIPIIAGDGLSMDVTAAGNLLEIKKELVSAIITPTTSASTSGFLSEPQLSNIQNNKSSCISLNDELYYISDNQENKGYLNFTHNTYENGDAWQKTITINTNNRSWVLNQVKLANADNVPSVDTSNFLKNTGGIMSGDIIFNTGYTPVVNSSKFMQRKNGAVTYVYHLPEKNGSIAMASDIPEVYSVDTTGNSVSSNLSKLYIISFSSRYDSINASIFEYLKTDYAIIQFDKYIYIKSAHGTNGDNVIYTSVANNSQFEFIQEDGNYSSMYSDLKKYLYRYDIRIHKILAAGTYKEGTLSSANDVFFDLTIYSTSYQNITAGQVAKSAIAKILTANHTSDGSFVSPIAGGTATAGAAYIFTICNEQGITMLTSTAEFYSPNYPTSNNKNSIPYILAHWSDNYNPANPSVELTTPNQWLVNKVTITTQQTN